MDKVVKISSFFKSISKKTEFKIISSNEFQENSFIYKDQNQTIKLELETNQKFLVLNQPTEIKISVENIDLRHSSIIGKGICLTGESGKNFFTVTTTVDEEGIINNHYPNW